MEFFKRLYRFCRYNKTKRLSLAALLLSAVYRAEILCVKPKRLEKRWGERNVETAMEESKEHYRYAIRVAKVVDRICNKTVWESKCLVRALTAQRLMKRKHIPTTLYLGCGVIDGKMVAHAWLRCGAMYVTGGNGEGYAVVSKFATPNGF